MTRTSLKMYWPLTALCALLAAQPAAAITFEQLAADGSGTGVFYTPTSSDASAAPTTTSGSCEVIRQTTGEPTPARRRESSSTRAA